MPMNPASITWPVLSAAVLFIDPEHPGAGRYEPSIPPPKLPDGYWTEPEDDEEWKEAA